MIERGDIRWFRFASPEKRRPVLVLGRGDLLAELAQVPVIPLSTQIRGLGWEVVLSEADGVRLARSSRNGSSPWSAPRSVLDWPRFLPQDGPKSERPCWTFSG